MSEENKKIGNEIPENTEMEIVEKVEIIEDSEKKTETTSDQQKTNSLLILGGIGLLAYFLSRPEKNN